MGKEAIAYWRNAEMGTRFTFERGTRTNPELTARHIAAVAAKTLREKTHADRLAEKREEASIRHVEERIRKQEAELQGIRSGRGIRWLEAFEREKGALDSLKAQRRVLKYSQHLRNAMGGRQPTSIQVLAMAALQHGLGSEELHTHANAMNALETQGQRARKTLKTWSGPALNRMFQVVKRGQTPVLARVEQQLRETPEGVTSTALAESLGITGREQQAVRTALRVLEAMGQAVEHKQRRGFEPSIGASWKHATVREAEE